MRRKSEVFAVVVTFMKVTPTGSGVIVGRFAIALSLTEAIDVYVMAALTIAAPKVGWRFVNGLEISRL